MAGFSSWFESNRTSKSLMQEYSKYCEEIRGRYGEDPETFKEWARSYFEENRSG